MIRTRDFLLYVIVFIFLISSIGVTFLVDTPFLVSDNTKTIEFSDPSNNEVAIITVPELNRRAENIARLKEKISRGEGLSAGPAVLTSVSTPEVSDGDSGDYNEIVRVIKTCSTVADYSKVISSWPSQGVLQKYVEGVRIYYIKNDDSVNFSTSTETNTKKDTVLLQLLAFNLRNPSDACIDGNVIGVTASGALLYNTDAVPLKNAGSTTLVGYALDGFPIYGPLADDTELDSCGGLQVPAGYQYHLRESEDFIIGCYAGTPTKFLLGS